MKVAVKTKSRLISEMLTDLFKRDGCQVCNLDAGESPDVFILDHNNINKELTLKWPAAKIVLIDLGIKKEDIAELIRAYKIDGIISTNTDIRHFKKALESVCKGKKWLYLDINEFMFGQNIDSKKRKDMTKREMDVIDLVCKGLTNKEIASRLSLSEQTIKAHISRIFRKLGILNRSQLVALFMKKA